MPTDPEWTSVVVAGPGDLAEALPYLFPVCPSNRIALIAVKLERSELGVRMTVPIPDIRDEWQHAAGVTAAEFLRHAEAGGQHPTSVIVLLCREPGTGESGAMVAEELRPLHEALGDAFADRGTPVRESVCISAGCWWSYQSAHPRGTGVHGTPVRSSENPGPLVAAATFAGITPAPSPEAISATFHPLCGEAAEDQARALNEVQRRLAPRLLEPDGDAALQEEVGELVDTTMEDFRAGASDLDNATAARLILGLADRIVRDRAMEHCEPEDLAHAQRLWRCLLHRCIPAYRAFAAAPLTLLGWAAWCAEDQATARVAIRHALELDPAYTLAGLLMKSLNTGLSPEPVRSTLRALRAERQASPAY